MKLDLRKRTEYTTEHAVMAHRMALLGLKDTEIASVFDISLNSLMRWCQDHPELDAALFTGRSIADAEVAESLHRRAVGCQIPSVKFFKMGNGDNTEIHAEHYIEQLPPDTEAAKFWLKTRQPELWKDQTHTAVSGSLEVTGSGLSGLLAMAKAAKADEC